MFSGSYQLFIKLDHRSFCHPIFWRKLAIATVHMCSEPSYIPIDFAASFRNYDVIPFIFETDLTFIGD